MKYNKLISFLNLGLAWRRITTGRNLQYKNYFRPLYFAYEIGLNENLKQLKQRLKGGWTPCSPSRIFYPKPTGLQRPITILCLEDQIVLQAIANIYSKKFFKRRKDVEKNVVFSNCLEKKDDSIFFLEDWHGTYQRFQKRIEKYFTQGFRWIAHFDLAAYYDTISHELLLKLLSPRGGNKETCDFIRKCFECWSSISSAKSFHHGIPQGPIASDFLAECFLLPIDEKMIKYGVAYIRYVDDIRIFSKTKIEAQRAAVNLEIACRNLGLIPQGQKFGIEKAVSLDDALGILPSLGPPGREPSQKPITMTSKVAEKVFKEAISGRPYQIKDKSRSRYVLYRAPKSKKLLSWVLLLMPRHPENIDAFMAYLSLYDKSKLIEKTIVKMIKEDIPYEYVKGELWQRLAKIGSKETLIKMRVGAEKDLKGSDNSLSLKWGIMEFLLSCQRAGLGKYSKKIKKFDPFIQALLMPSLPEVEYESNGIVKNMLVSDSFEPGIVLAEQLVKRKKTHNDYGIRVRNLSRQVQNVFRELNIIQRRSSYHIDQIGEILHHRYGVSLFQNWGKIFYKEYGYALQILRQADATFDAGPSHWLQLQNSFNDALFRSVQEHLNTAGSPFAMKTKNIKGELINFGGLLDKSKAFSRKYPDIADPFRAANRRRNALPPSHPYDKKKGVRNRHLGRREQQKLRVKLGKAYAKIITLF